MALAESALRHKPSDLSGKSAVTTINLLMQVNQAADHLISRHYGTDRSIRGFGGPS